MKKYRSCGFCTARSVGLRGSLASQNIMAGQLVRCISVPALEEAAHCAPGFRGGARWRGHRSGRPARCATRAEDRSLPPAPNNDHANDAFSFSLWVPELLGRGGQLAPRLLNQHEFRTESVEFSLHLGNPLKLDLLSTQDRVHHLSTLIQEIDQVVELFPTDVHPTTLREALQPVRATTACLFGHGSVVNLPLCRTRR
jgi:hypothetical protein